MRRRIFVYAAPNARRWISEELLDVDCELHEASTIDEFRALTTTAAPRRAIAIVDVDLLQAGELLELHAMQRDTRPGAFIGLGHVPREVQSSLRITHVIERPLGSEALRTIISQLGQERDTTEIKRLDS